jgi:hypothetical protein
MCGFRNNAVLASMLAGALAGALLLSTAALAAGAYDGTWTAKETSGGCAGTVVTVTVADNVASANWTGAKTASFHGKSIDADGTVSWTGRSGGRTTKLIFSGNKFDMESNASCGHLSVTGGRQ